MQSIEPGNRKLNEPVLRLMIHSCYSRSEFTMDDHSFTLTHLRHTIFTVVNKNLTVLVGKVLTNEIHMPTVKVSKENQEPQKHYCKPEGSNGIDGYKPDLEIR